MVNFVKRDKNDIFSIPFLKTIFKNRFFIKAVQIIVLALFVYGIYYGFENPTKENIFTKNLFWGLFWSLFMVVSLVSFGRIFCGICPHGFLGKYITKYGLKLEMPKFLKNRYIGITILVVGWWGIYYTFPGALKIPYATAIMFSVLTLVAFVFYFLYKDMSYCKYICPIGNLTKAYQKVSFTKLGTYSDSCSSCRTFECTSACSYNLKPFTFEKKNSMDDCTLCMDCSSACESVNFKLIPPTSSLYNKNKIENSDIWVYLLIFASITLSMNFHHALGRSAISDSFIWSKTANYIQEITGISGLDFVGMFAFIYSIIFVVVIAFFGMYMASLFLKQKFSTTFYTLGYAYAPLFIIAGLGHLLHSFFTHTYADILNGFIQGFNLDFETVSNLASRKDSWLMIFEFIPYIAMLIAFVILYKRLKLFIASKARKIGAFIFASSLILAYLSISIYKVYVFKTYGAKKTSHNHSTMEHKTNQGAK